MISFYGLILGVAVVTAGWLVERILSLHITSSKSKTPTTSTWMAGYVCILLFGLVGARAYHVATDWALYQGQPLWSVLAVWQGGLGILGALAGGAIGVEIWHRGWRVPWSRWELADALAIGLPFGQAIGRLGNWVNQELFGPPTTLPWGIAIDPANRPEQFVSASHFHPLFAYESLSMLFTGLVFWSLWLWGKREPDQPFWRLGSGWWLSLYFITYGLVRFSLDFLRWDLSPAWLDLTWSQWGALVAVTLGLGILATRSRALLKLSVVAILAGVLGYSRLGSIVATPVLAQSAASLELSIEPAVVQIVVQPGKTVTQALTITNASTLDLEVTAMLADFGSDGYSGQAVLRDTNTFPYAKLNNADRALNEPFILPAGGQQQLVMAIAPPENAPQRDWYFTLLATTKPAPGTLAGQNSPLQAQTNGTIGANFLVTVSQSEPGDVNWELGLGPLPRLLDSFQQLPIPIRVENTGNHVAQPDISVLVLNWRDEVVYEADGLPDRVLAHSRREIFTGIPSRDDPRSLEPVGFVFDPFFAVGPYTVRATLRNNTTGPIVLEQTVWAFPIVLVGSIILTIALILAVKSKKLSPGLKNISE